MMNFGSYSNPAKLVMIFDMLAGRLEIFPMLVFFMPDTWRRSEQNNKADALPPECIRFLLYQDSCGFFPKSATPLSTMTPPSRARPAPACPKASPTAPTRGLAGSSADCRPCCPR